MIIFFVISGSLKRVQSLFLTHKAVHPVSAATTSASNESTKSNKIKVKKIILIDNF